MYTYIHLRMMGAGDAVCDRPPAGWASCRPPRSVHLALLAAVPYHGKKSLTIEGNPLLQKEIPYYKEILYYLRKAITVEGIPLL